MIRSMLFALVASVPVFAQGPVPVPDVPGLPPEVAALIRRDVASINQLATTPFPKMAVPAFDPVPFPALPAFEPLPAFPAFPAGPGNYSYSTYSSTSDEWSLNNDRFRLKFTDNGSCVKVCGKLVDGRPVLDEIVHQDRAVASIDDLPVAAKKRLLNLLDAKLAR